MKIYDLIGIGFGPSNIALAITLDEKKQAGHHVESFFIEKQPSFAWHANMMLDNAHMQVSFLKDLATMRNPSSHFTFVNYAISACFTSISSGSQSPRTSWVG